MSKDSKVITKFKPFVLGFCNCGCGGSIPITNKAGYLMRYLFGHGNIGRKRLDMAGSNNYFYKNGSRKRNDEKYIQILKPEHPYCDSQGYVYKHRLILEEYYTKIRGVPVYFDPEIFAVHHKDGDTFNNNYDNLQLVTHSYHSTITHKEDMSNRICLLCGSKKTYIEKKTGWVQWLSYEDGYICRKCYDKNRNKKNKNTPL